jgi:hypothetical protein
MMKSQTNHVMRNLIEQNHFPGLYIKLNIKEKYENEMRKYRTVGGEKADSRGASGVHFLKHLSCSIPCRFHSGWLS